MLILVADDEIPVAEFLADVMEWRGHDVAVAHDGVDALALYRRQPPDALFLDVHMPAMSGLEVLRALRETDSESAVVLVTGHATPAVREHARRLGIYDILEKPFSLDRVKTLLDALARAARGGNGGGEPA